MTRDKSEKSFRCHKCEEDFWGSDSFHGAYTIMRSDVKNVQLCLKCTYETTATWSGEAYYLRGQIEREIENCIMQHGIDRHADVKRIAYEKVLDLIDNSEMFNGYNKRSGYGRDLSNTELEARRIVHGEFKINFEEQIKLTRNGFRYLVDGLIPMKGKEKDIVLEFDSDYWHSTDEQKEKDRYKDSKLIAWK